MDQLYFDLASIMQHIHVRNQVMRPAASPLHRARLGKDELTVVIDPASSQLLKVSTSLRMSCLPAYPSEWRMQYADLLPQIVLPVAPACMLPAGISGQLLKVIMATKDPALRLGPSHVNKAQLLQGAQRMNCHPAVRGLGLYSKRQPAAHAPRCGRAPVWRARRPFRSHRPA